MNKIIMATAAIALLSSSAVFGAEPSASTATPNSGVGVKGAPGSTNGPADSNANGATANPNNSTGNMHQGAQVQENRVPAQTLHRTQRA